MCWTHHFTKDEVLQRAGKQTVTGIDQKIVTVARTCIHLRNTQKNVVKEKIKGHKARDNSLQKWLEIPANDLQLLTATNDNIMWKAII